VNLTPVIGEVKLIWFCAAILDATSVPPMFAMPV
jgi:hypothetical protein